MFLQRRATRLTYDRDLTSTTALAKATRAAGLIHEDRASANALASEVLAEAGEDDHEARATAHRVIANVLVQRGQATQAAEHIDQAVESATASDDRVLLGRVLLTRMAVEIVGGEAQRAVATSHLAEPLLPVAEQVQVRIQRATALGRGLGRAVEAIAEYDRVVLEFPDLPPQVELVLRMNRGSQHVTAENLELAISDFDCALELCRQLDNGEAESEVMLHLASAAARAGDVPRVFVLHREILERSLIHRSDVRTLGDLADALMVAGLNKEALALVDEAFESGDDRMRLEGVELVVRAVHLLARIGRAADAQRLAEVAKARSPDVENAVLSARVVLAEQLAKAAAGDLTAVDPAVLVRAGEQLAAEGWREEATESRLLAAKSLMRRGDHDGCKATLAPLLRRHVTGVASHERAQLTLARALMHVANGNEAEARRVLARGLGHLDRARARIGSHEVRSSASDRGPELARLGLELAAASGRPRSILSWAERQRAAALRLSARSVTSVDRETVERLRRDSIGEDERAAAVAAMRSRRQDATRVETVRTDRLIKAAHGRRLVEFVDLDGMLCALTIVNGRVRFVRDLARTADVEGQIDRLLFGLRRMATGADRRSSTAAEMVESVASELDSTLLSGVPDGTDDIVIIPTGRLHLLPWRALPRLRARSFTVGPSGHLWAACEQLRPGADEMSAVMGPNLPAAEAELRAIGTAWGRQVALEPARIDRALDSMQRSHAVHICAHGEFRNDNAFFSALEMADGPLYVYDFETLAEMPTLIIMSACSLGTVEVLRSDDVLGFPAAILAGGARSLVAAMLQVEDLAARDLMVELHRNIASGQGAARSLASAAAATFDRSPQHFAAAIAFQCFGAA